MGPAIFRLTLQAALQRFREDFEREEMEAFTYMDDVSALYGGHAQHG